jgi:serine protease AprX
MNKGQIERLSHVPWVVQVEYDHPVYATLGTATTWFGVQKARTDFGVTGDRNGNETSYTKDDIVVAIIDTGIDPNHVDLDGGKIIAWKDYVNSQTTPYDDHGHGTHCASIATGEGQGNPTYKGVAPGAALVGVKVLDSAGSGSMANVDAGIQWCIDNKATYGIEVISLSLGTSGSSDGTDSTSQMVNSAYNAGLVPCVAAGNSGPAKYTIGSPGAAANAITVAAVADVGEMGFQLANFSSRGPTADNRTKPDIAAPGVNIMAADSGTTNQYVSMSGTSMATPFTAGSCALMLDANPSLTPTQVRSKLTTTALSWGPAGQDVDYGFGRLDAYAAVKSAGGYTGTGPAVPGHDYKFDSLSGTGQYKEYTYNVTSTTYPISVTMIMPDWASSSNPDFELYLFNPGGTQIASSTGSARQEQVGVSITATGNYKVKVSSYAGSGNFFFDISAGLGAGGDNPPTCSIYQPTPGATVSGTYRIKVSAADDVGLSKVETQIDTGSWINITANFDGTYYFYDWVTTGYANGSHTVNARATDTISQVTNATPVTVTVSNGGGGNQHTLTFNGTVTSTARDAWFNVNVASVGYIYLTLNWGTAADLDFFVYGPSGAEVGRAYTTSKPETLRVYTDTYGTGLYRVKVNLYSGVNTSFTLTVDGYQKKTWTGSVTPASPNSWVNVACDYTGNSYFKLDWGSASNDLDFFVYDPTGALRSQAYTISKPETLWQVIDRTGTWQVKVNLYSGSSENYTLTVYVPEDNLY